MTPVRSRALLGLGVALGLVACAPEDDAASSDDQDYIASACEPVGAERRLSNQLGDMWIDYETSWTSCIAGASSSELMTRIETLVVDDDALARSGAFAEYKASPPAGDLAGSEGVTRDVKVRFAVRGLDLHVAMRVTAKKEASGTVTLHAVNTSGLAKKLVGVRVHELVPAGNLTFSFVASPAGDCVKLQGAYRAERLDLLSAEPFFGDDGPAVVSTAIADWLSASLAER
jgi:hypothetical protein